MDLNLNLLKHLIDLPTQDPNELRHILDDVGLEVKDVVQEGGQTIFKIETLANRGEHLCALGAARELSARYLTQIKYPKAAFELENRKPSVLIRNETDKCLRYALLELTLPARLKLKPEISTFLRDPDPNRAAIVHYLNYIQTEIGQPMHAFDRDKIEGEIHIVLSEREEEVEALDGHKYKVPPQSILIRDKKKTIAVAGVIGLANSMVSPETTRVLIESATFDPISVRKTARKMGLSTDASYAFERGTDPEGALFALKRLSHLIAGAGDDSAKIIGVAEVVTAELPTQEIKFTLDGYRQEVNIPDLDSSEISSRLERLGYTVKANKAKDEFLVIPPPWRRWARHTVNTVLDDFCRSYGFNRTKLTLPALDYEAPPIHPTQNLFAKIDRALHGNGFIEVITRSYYSAADVKLLDQLSPGLEKEHLALANSLEKGYSHMKITNLIHMANLAGRNHRQGVLSCKVYEFGRLFARKKPVTSPYEFEWDVLSLCASGRWLEHEWRKPESTGQLALLFKGTLESVFEALGANMEVVSSDNPLLHPGMQSQVKVGKLNCGFFGVIHPWLKEKLDLKEDLVYGEFDGETLMKLLGAKRPKVAITDLPTVRRDVTLKVGTRNLAADVVRQISELGPQNLKTVDIADDFRKEGEDFRRVTYRLTFQNPKRTLERSEVDSEMEIILKTLESKFDLKVAV